MNWRQGGKRALTSLSSLSLSIVRDRRTTYDINTELYSFQYVHRAVKSKHVRLFANQGNITEQAKRQTERDKQSNGQTDTFRQTNMHTVEMFWRWIKSWLAGLCDINGRALHELSIHRSTLGPYSQLLSRLTRPRARRIGYQYAMSYVW